MPSSKKILLFAVLGPWLTLTACGHHTATSKGTLKPSSTFSAPREKALEAIEAGDVDTLLQLLNEGLETDAKLSNGRTLLIHATIQGRLKIMRLLLDRGADPALKDEADLSALDHARAAGNTRAEVLLDPARRDTELASLMDAIKKKRTMKVSQQLESGADPNRRDPLHGGETPLTLAVEVSSPLVVEILASWRDAAGITDTIIDLKNEAGLSGLAKAKALGRADVVQILESLGAKE